MRILKILSIGLLSIALISGCKSVKKITQGDNGLTKLFNSIGGKAGKQIDKYMDIQVVNLSRELKNATVRKEKESIRVTFESGVLFALSSADLGIVAKANITRLADVLNKYSETLILVEGHTDNTGDMSFNQMLSANRAKSVASFLISKGVNSSRLNTKGFGPSRPVVDNTTSANRALNRRVELVVYPSDDLVKKAKSGSIDNLF